MILEDSPFLVTFIAQHGHEHDSPNQIINPLAKCRAFQKSFQPVREYILLSLRRRSSMASKVAFLIPSDACPVQIFQVVHRSTFLL